MINHSLTARIIVDDQLSSTLYDTTQRMMRGARIDKLCVDRSRYKALPVGHWSVEAQTYEPQLEAARAELTIADRMTAWRALFKLTVKS